jgi:hypothetical protein
MIGRVGTILASFLFFLLEVPHQADLILPDQAFYLMG